jgi:Tol biopolymer transport system component
LSNLRRTLFGGLATLTLAGLTAASAAASSLPARTLALSTAVNGTAANGASADPVLSASGRVIAFDTTATNVAGDDLNGPLRDVVAIDLATNERRLVSQGAVAADGPSTAPAISANGQRVVFASTASNLVPGDTNGVSDIFIRDGRGPIIRISVAAGGVQANGASAEPDISADGNVVTYTSAASNLAPGDTNGQTDVFAINLQAGAISRVSVASSGRQATGRSSGPAISADGTTVAFVSAASDLVSDDKNGVTDVFVRDLIKRRTERVSVSTTGRQQNHSVTPPFVQIADVSSNGRYVVFDSDATTLYTPDTNRHTDVFLRDRTAKTTALVSASSTNVQGNNDSFAPRLTPNGRFLTFESFATNLAAGDGPREDIFERDLLNGTTTVVNVTATGVPRGPELVPQILQRPALSNDGTFAAFASTVTNLVANDGNGAQDVFVRQLDPPVGRFVSRPRAGHAGTIKLAADDAQAKQFLCQVDAKRPYACGPSVRVSPTMGRMLHIRAGGPGLQWSTDRLSFVLNNDRTKPRVSVSKTTKSPLRVVRGRATDAGGIQRVDVSFVYFSGKGCRYLITRKRFSGSSLQNCIKHVLVKASGKRNWSLRLPVAIRGPYVVIAVATDTAGNVSKPGTFTGFAL